ncbi:MAG TPA: protein-L-isoaspartate(D-aspartate) O-methyltransferase [Syntrophobacter fumaroxidans]|nr:protein-L-isoaspartate(D-aspartate) O-methyltransferase [Syntrophobacter fumaroxidans]
MSRKSTGAFLVILLLSMAAGGVVGAADDPYDAARAKMVREIEDDARRTSERIGKTALDPRVMEIMARVPRHEFVPAAERTYAYENRPLPIGYGQTISQPYIVAVMTDLLEVGSESTVLEVGTGSGYQAAILAEYVRSVYSIEIIEELAESAAERLKRLGYDNVRVRTGDGYHGWKEHAPFDGIVVTAAAGHIPPPLLDQLKPGGRMIIPVGGPFFVQQLMLVEKDEQGKTRTRQILPVAFVPLTGGH